MNDVQFQEDNSLNQQRRRSNEDRRKGAIMKFLNKQGLDDEQAKKVMYAVAIGAFLLSLFFWF